MVPVELSPVTCCPHPDFWDAISVAVLFLGSWSEFANKCVPHLDLHSLLPGGIWPRNGTNTRF